MNRLRLGFTGFAAMASMVAMAAYATPYTPPPEPHDALREPRVPQPAPCDYRDGENRRARRRNKALRRQKG